MPGKKKIEYGSRAWNRAVLEIADQYLIIHQCKKCSYPVNKGYCCGYCGDSNPTNTVEEDKAFERLCEEKARNRW